MWNEQLYQPLQSSNGQPRLSKSAPCSPLKPLLAKRPFPARADSFHVIHKVPVGDTAYVKAKHVQLVDKDPNRAVALFWAAINAGDRVDSALKDMAIVMKQQNRPEEAIEAIKSLRYRCSDHAQESLDNVLLDLYKRCGRLDDQIALLKHKLHLIHQGLAFNGRRTKTARSQGKKFQVSVEQEATRLLGNLGWAYMQQSNYVAAEAVYRKALSIEPDNNKVCNLGICLMQQGRLKEGRTMLRSVKPASGDSPWGSDSHLKSFERAQQMLMQMEEGSGAATNLIHSASCSDEEPLLSSSSWRLWSNLNPLTDSDFSGALFATAGFGPAQRPPLPPILAATSVPLLPEARTPQRLQHQRNSSWSSTGNKTWAEEDEEQGFANENSHRDQLEVLRQKLERVMAVKKSDGTIGNHEPGRGALNPQPLERSNSADAPSLNARLVPSSSMAESSSSVLNSSARPFVAKSFSKLSAAEGIRTCNLPNESSNERQGQQPKSARPQQLLVPDKSSISRKSCCKSLSFSAPSEPNGDIVVENSSSPDMWSRLGFIQGESSSPLCTIATALRKKLSKPTILPDLQDTCQRRLQVFVDMTLPASPSQA